MRECRSSWLFFCCFLLGAGGCEGHVVVQAILQFPYVGYRASFQSVNDLRPGRRRLAHAAAQDTTAVSTRRTGDVCRLHSARTDSSITTTTTTTTTSPAAEETLDLGGRFHTAFVDIFGGGLLRWAAASSNTSAFGANNRAGFWYPPPPALPLWFPPPSSSDRCNQEDDEEETKKPFLLASPFGPPPDLSPSGSNDGNCNNSSSEQQQHRWHKKLWKSPVHWFRAAEKTHLFLRSMATATEDFTKTVVPNGSSPSTGSSDSVHLKLNPPPPPEQPRENKNNNNNNNNNGSHKKQPAMTTLKVLSYVHPRTGQTWKAINTVKRKFVAFLEYNNVLTGTETPVIVTMEHTFAPNSRSDQLQQERLRGEWRKLWKQRRLLTDRTEFLAVYPSDTESSAKQQKSSSTTSSTKRGGFADLLHLYRERLVAILEDERNDSSRHALVLWLQDHYGPEATNRLRANNLRQLSEPEQLAQLKDFLEWFRGYFPYFYDKCGVCGASIKEDYANNRHENSPFFRSTSEDGEEEEEKGYQTFLGYVYPGEGELKGKASRTELYQCHKCHSFTRFPRYNSAWHVMESRRGRCGEYSMLLYRFLRALDHETRWVVDWADHVWAEVYLPTSLPRWVHLDPCEAAVDENLIYQGWGKKQTYILGFYAPRPGDHERYHTPIIQDVTSSYTSEDVSAIQQRREESPSQIHAAIVDASEQLRIKLDKMESGPGLPLEPWKRPL